ncbi:arginase family protein [Modestobacter versicolor]|nr:arginase family protein [Modestobacter versicolor]
MSRHRSRAPRRVASATGPPTTVARLPTRPARWSPPGDRCQPRTMTQGIGVIGVPTTAGSHNAGQEKAPAALRAAGLVDALRAAGVDVEDTGDLAVRRHRPTPPVDGVRDLDRVVELAAEVADRVSEVHAAGRRPLVLGGDCTVTLGVVAGLARHVDVGLAYVDGDADLNTPGGSTSGVLDTMGTTHLLGGGAPALAGLGPRVPLLPDDHLELFGFDPGELDTDQWTQLVAHRLSATPAPVVRTDPAGHAAAALRRLEAAADAVLVHLDVDVLDTNDFPLANFPHSAGLALDEVAAALAVFCSSDALAGLVLTEVNPDHDPDGVLLPRIVEVVAAALTPGQSPPATRRTAPVQ